MARLICENGKILFSTPCDTSFFPSRKEQLMRALDKVQFISRKNRQILKSFALTIQDIKTCSHGDFSMGNLLEKLFFADYFKRQIKEFYL